jgi:hypothetical protein
VYSNFKVHVIIVTLSSLTSLFIHLLLLYDVCFCLILHPISFITFHGFIENKQINNDSAFLFTLMQKEWHNVSTTISSWVQLTTSKLLYLIFQTGYGVYNMKHWSSGHYTLRFAHIGLPDLVQTGSNTPLLVFCVPI